VNGLLLQIGEFEVVTMIEAVMQMVAGMIARDQDAAGLTRKQADSSYLPRLSPADGGNQPQATNQPPGAPE